MTDALRLAAGTAGFVGAGIALATSLRFRSFSAFVLGSYVLGWAWLVAATLALSPLRWATWAGLLAASGVALAVSLGVWVLSGRPHPRRAPVRWLLKEVRRDPVVFALLTVVLVALGYTLALAVAVAPNDWDALTYHLARAAFWKQRHAIGLIGGATDNRLNVNPPNAEIGQMFVLTLDNGDRFANVIQYAALIATSVGVYSLGRRIGLPVRGGLFGALLFTLLPLPLMQGSSALSDMLVSSFLVAAVFFLLSTSTTELVMGGVALALALGTKFTGPLALPVIALIAVAGPARRRMKLLVSVGICGVVLGGYWYVVNIVETGRPDGRLASTAGQNGALTPSGLVWRATHYLLGELQFPGAVDGGAAAFLVIGVTCIAAALVLRRSPAARSLAIGGAIVGALPLAAIGSVWILGQLGAPGSDYAHTADTVVPWYGPVALLLVPVSSAIAVRAGRADRSRVVELVLVSAPLTYGVVILFGLSYDPWRGRFFAFAFALSAAVWGLALQRRAVAIAASVLAGATAALCLGSYVSKPSGFNGGGSAWKMSRLSQQLILRHRDGTAAAIRFVSQNVSAHASVGLALAEDNYISPYFGHRYTRQVSLLELSQPNVPENMQWIVASSPLALSRCAWDTVFRFPRGWRIYRRAVETCS